MSRREYHCSECGHVFRLPQSAPRDTRSLMCPACGSIDLTMSVAARPVPAVMRARQPAPATTWWRRRAKAS
jgi:DNA-directed RNA polymerase subunit RPC12/RpoP